LTQRIVARTPTRTSTTLTRTPAARVQTVTPDCDEHAMARPQSRTAWTVTPGRVFTPVATAAMWMNNPLLLHLLSHPKLFLHFQFLTDSVISVKAQLFGGA